MRKKTCKMVALLLTLAVVMSSLVGCGMTMEEEKTRTIVDIMGVEVEIPVEVDEIINLYSFGCQMMAGLGLEEYLVGINQDTFETEWLEVMCPEMKEIKTYSDEVDAETLLAANADIVFCADPDRAEELRGKGVTCITFVYMTIDDLKFNVNLLGEILGGDAKEKCEQYIQYLDGQISDVNNAWKIINGLYCFCAHKLV